MSPFARTLVALSLATPLFAACAQINAVMEPLGLGLGAKQTLETEVGQLRSMRAELEQSWNEVQSRVASVETDVNTFGPAGLAGADVDLSVVGDDILSMTEVEVTEAGAPQVRTVDIEAAYRGTDAATRQEIAQVQTEGKRIMSELSEGIPTTLASMSTDAMKTVAKAAAIQIKAQNLGTVASKNPLMSDADMATMKANTARIESEVNELSLLADRIANESSGMSQRLTLVTTNFQSKVTAFK